jgi:hypothetical protein
MVSGSKIRQAQLSAAVNCTSLAGAATAAAAQTHKLRSNLKMRGSEGPRSDTGACTKMSFRKVTGRGLMSKSQGVVSLKFECHEWVAKATLREKDTGGYLFS